jgi:fibronectin-binding autotransporter adhesin
VVGGTISSVSSGTFTLTNSIIADSPNGNDCYTLGTSIADGGYNIDDDGSCGFGTSTGANGRTIGDNVNLLLDLNGLQNNGGPTQTIALQPNSPAIDAASGVGAGIERAQTAHLCVPSGFIAYRLLSLEPM